MVDANALRANQAFVIVLLVLGFILGEGAGTWLVLGVGAVLALGTATNRLALFQQVYFQILRPARLIKPALREESATPHRFAQAVGALVTLAGGLIVLLTPVTALGWALVWIVVALAVVNLFAGFCLGCFMYLHLDRMGLLPASISDRARRAPADG